MRFLVKRSGAVHAASGPGALPARRQPTKHAQRAATDAAQPRSCGARAGSAWLALLAALLLGSTGPAPAAQPLRVVASFGILADWIGRVGAPHVDIVTLVPTGGDVHVYKPRPSDVRALASADAVFVNGLGLEGWLERLVRASGTKAPVFVTSNGIRTLPLDDNHRHVHDSYAHKDDHGTAHAELGAAYDPHGWQTVDNARRYVQNLAAGLCRVDASHCAHFEQRLATYLDELHTLDTDIRTRLGALPHQQRVAVITHNGLRYFGHAYGVDFVAVSGAAGTATARPAQMATVIRLMRERRIDSVFLQYGENPRMLEQLARDTGARVAGTLYSDSLSPADGPAATYIDMMRHNAETLGSGMARKSLR